VICSHLGHLRLVDEAELTSWSRREGQFRQEKANSPQWNIYPGGDSGECPRAGPRQSGGEGAGWGRPAYRGGIP
jgi:hypothetical protein